MPRGIPKATKAEESVSLWDVYCAAALTGLLSRPNTNTGEACGAAIVAADKIMEQRAARFPSITAS